MTSFSFVKEAGEKLIGFLDADGSSSEEALKEHIKREGLGSPAISALIEGDKVVLKGEVVSQEECEKIVLVTGNVQGVASVDSELVVSGPAGPASQFMTVQRGDTLSTVAKRAYGNPMYKRLFEANQPMLRDPNKIYPGQSLRAPE